MQLTLKELGRSLKKTQRQIDQENKFFKTGFSEKRIQALSKVKTSIMREVAARQNPLNAVRCSLPKKKQRQLGMLPEIKK